MDERKKKKTNITIQPSVYTVQRVPDAVEVTYTHHQRKDSIIPEVERLQDFSYKCDIDNLQTQNKSEQAFSHRIVYTLRDSEQIVDRLAYTASWASIANVVGRMRRDKTDLKITRGCRRYMVAIRRHIAPDAQRAENGRSVNIRRGEKKRPRKLIKWRDREEFAPKMKTIFHRLLESISLCENEPRRYFLAHKISAHRMSSKSLNYTLPRTHLYIPV